MKILQNLTLSAGILFAAASAQAATINCTPAVQRAHIATLESQVRTLTTQVEALQSQSETSPQQTVVVQPASNLPLGAQFDIATGG